METSGPDVLQFLEHIFVRKISNLKQELTESLTEFESLSDNFQKKCSVETNED